MGWVILLTDLTKKRRALPAWVLAIGLFLATLGLRSALPPWLTMAPFLIFYPGIMATALLCGWLPATAMLLLSCATGRYYYQPAHFFAAPDAPVVARTVAFLAVGAIQIVLLAALAELVRRLDQATHMQETLFTELQHRVANNMQIVAGTLQATRRGLTDPAAREMLAIAASRIGAMGQLHRRLYNRSTYANGLEPILREVPTETFHNMQVQVDLDIQVKKLSIDQMTAILLFVNEAALNAAKHVFRAERGTKFDVSLTQRKPGWLRLVVADDGPGLGPIETASEEGQKLGLTIMKAFAHQLGGPLQVLAAPGARLQVEFPAR